VAVAGGVAVARAELQAEHGEDVGVGGDPRSSHPRTRRSTVQQPPGDPEVGRDRATDAAMDAVTGAATDVVTGVDRGTETGTGTTVVDRVRGAD
jgi:hypothetical protein